MSADHSWTPSARGVALMLAFVAVVLLFWPASASLAELWADEDRRTYTHGYLIAAVSLWLLWRHRELATRPDTVRTSPSQVLALLAVLAATVLLWQLSYRAGFSLATQVLLLPLLWLTVLISVGWNAARASLLPIAYLAFALTIWDFINPGAQWLSVHAVRFMLRAVDIPAYFSGNYVQIPSGTFEIAEGCSGLHFIIVALALAVLVGEVRGDTWRIRLRWCVLAVALAMISNWARIFIIIVAGHLSHMQNYLVRESHYGFGWAVFGFALVVLLLIERRMPERKRAPALPSISPGNRPPSLLRWVPCAVVLALPLIENHIIESRLAGIDVVGAADWLQRAARERGWSASVVESSDWRPTQHGSDIALQRRFQRQNSTVETYLALYREQKTGAKLGGYANRLHGDASVLESGREAVEGRTFVSRLLELDGRRSLMWFKYRTGNRDFTSAERAQLWYSWQTVRSARSVPSEAFAAWAPCEPDCDAAREMLASFIRDIGDGM